MKKIVYLAISFVMLVIFTVASNAATEKTMQYDDYFTPDGTVQIISQSPETGTSVIELTDGMLHATGLGTAIVEINGDRTNIKVEKASVHIALMMGQSNSGNNCGNLDEAVECEKGTAYYWNAISKTTPDAMTKQKHYRSTFASEWYKQSCLYGSPEKVAIVHVAGVTYVDGVSITSDAPYDQKFGWINKNSDGFYLSNAGKNSLTAFMNCYDYFADSPFYDITTAGVYWFQGEHDPDVDRLAADGRKYIDYYKNLWTLLKSGSNGRLQYFTAFRVKGSDAPANYTLGFCDPLNAQYYAANTVDDMYIATNITEEWYGEKSVIDIDTSKYLTADTNKISMTFDKMYGYNKAHYYQPAYNILGMDAAYNMFRTLKNINPEPDTAVILGRSGKDTTRIECKAGNNTIADLDTLSDFCINLKPGCIKDTTLKTSIISGNNDITDEVLNYNGIIDINLLREYALTNETKIICAFYRNGQKTGEAVFNTDAASTGNYYHWDFTDNAAYRTNEYGGTTVSAAADGECAWMLNQKSGAVTHSADGMTVKQSHTYHQFILNKNISTCAEKGYVIECTLKLNDLSHGGIIFGGKDSGKTIWGYFTNDELSKIVLGNSGSMYFNTDDADIDFGNFATYRFAYTPAGICTLTVTQNDFSKTYSAVIQSGTYPVPEIDRFLPYLDNTRYFFDGTVKDLKIWTSYGSYECSANGTHNYSDFITKANTCTDNGIKYRQCSVCGAVTEKIVIPAEHTIITIKGTPSTCTSDGQTDSVICTACGFVFTAPEKIKAEGHKDADNNSLCDVCGNNISIKCSCNCHKSGFMGFIWKIQRFFYKLFGTNNICRCGIAHY